MDAFLTRMQQVRLLEQEAVYSGIKYELSWGLRVSSLDDSRDLGPRFPFFQFTETVQFPATSLVSGFPSVKIEALRRQLYSSSGTINRLHFGCQLCSSEKDLRFSRLKSGVMTDW